MKKYYLIPLLVLSYYVATAQLSPEFILEKGKAVAIQFTYNGDLKRLSVALQNNPRPIFGQFLTEGDKTIFRAAIPFAEGQEYVIKEGEKLLSQFRFEGDNEPPPIVLAVYPSSNTVPANQLKMYVKFDQPMRADGVYEHIYVADENGRRLPVAILPLQPALWNADNTMLTLWFDPGKIKRDLQPNQMHGTPLQPGKRYSLIVEGAFSSQKGDQLGQQFSRPFSTGDDDRVKPDLEKWKLVAPSAGSNDALTVQFGEPMDFGSLDGKFSVKTESGDGQIVDGVFEITAGETGLTFKPAKSWLAGSYVLVVDPTIEDLAGNNLQRLFDEDTTVENPDLAKQDWHLKFIIR
ncbi:Ig-like domain-containing protein [Imperialibacter roseus]|uniref:Ig-like domain-containing protein n=1 Tax=Imperialibacter roseus TaxID=1324217 RepID=A0ABZ0IUZ8_9BACT|nr:Ig-like domain-containing protein [Imperialibacter roseus]WOK08880.1 Ig-like domain-containing protein [Imperialibacter roseus]